jgi:hypothetical protein
MWHRWGIIVDCLGYNLLVLHKIVFVYLDLVVFVLLLFRDNCRYHCYRCCRYCSDHLSLPLLLLVFVVVVFSLSFVLPCGRR